MRYFGVSNHCPSQIALLQKYVKQGIQANQIQFSIPFSNTVAAGLEKNMRAEGAVDRSGDVLDYCRLNDITVQAWTPFQSVNGSFVDNNEKHPDLNWALGEIGAKYSVSKTTVAAAWILRHPAKIQTIAGTMNFSGIGEIAKATDIVLTHDEWYRLYLAAGHILP